MVWTGIAFGIFYLVCLTYFLIGNAASAYYVDTAHINPLGLLGDVMAIVALIPFLAMGYLSGSVVGVVLGGIANLVLYVAIGVGVARIVTYRPDRNAQAVPQKMF